MHFNFKNVGLVANTEKRICLDHKPNFLAAH